MTLEGILFIAPLLSRANDIVTSATKGRAVDLIILANTVRRTEGPTASDFIDDVIIRRGQELELELEQRVSLAARVMHQCVPSEIQVNFMCIR